MDKKQVIEFIEAQIESGKISRGDLKELVGGGHPDSKSHANQSKNLINVFYSIGAIIALVGVGILVAQNWNEIGFSGRILVTLGLSVATYIAALLLKTSEQRTISSVLFTFSAALAPMGVYVLLNEADIKLTLGNQALAGVILAVIYGTALYVSKRNILTLITIAFASWSYFTLILKYFEFDALYSYSVDYLKWATMLLGVAYILIAYGYRSIQESLDTEEHEGKSVQHVLYGLGTLAILGAGISIGGAFDLVFILVIFAAFYGSVYLRSRAMLIFGAIFLAAHIIKLTSKYFIDSIGWPVALIAVGFLVIGIGYATFYLNKKFISEK